MPAMLDDPASGTIHRVSGEQPFPDPSHPALPPSVTVRHVTLRDRQTAATVVPFASRSAVPESLLRYLGDQFNKEIEGGDTYPMLEGMPSESFAAYWFQNFAGVMLLGRVRAADEVVEGKDWSRECLGAFYIKPNYPGRSSHVCNAGFIVTDASRNRGVGRLMGESYLAWAPRLGYTYSVFNLVYETNVASCRIWDGLGFKRIGRVKGAGNLRSHPDQLVDAIIYGRDLGVDGPDTDPGAAGELVSAERFAKIKFYLLTSRYPSGADRAEKSRLRSAATHYKLLDSGVLMLKDKEVVSDPARQYEIARGVHREAHAGINKTTAMVAEKYHWSRIKETVSDVIRLCSECTNSSTSSLVGTPGDGGVVSLPQRSSAAQQQFKKPSPGPSMQGQEFMAMGEQCTNPVNLFATQPPAAAYYHQPADPQIMAASTGGYYGQEEESTFQALLAADQLHPDHDQQEDDGSTAALGGGLEMLLGHHGEDETHGVGKAGGGEVVEEGRSGGQDGGMINLGGSCLGKRRRSGGEEEEEEEGGQSFTTMF